MKTYGQIYGEAYDAFMVKHGAGASWKWDGDHEVLEEQAKETSAQAVIEEFKRRHDIVIVPEED